MKSGYEQTVTMFGKALAGVYGEGINEDGNRFSVSIPDYRLFPYYGELIEGGIIVDKSVCDETVVIRSVISGGMLDLKVPAGKIARFSSKEIVSGKYEDAKAFDYVALDIYVEYWRKNGARIGVRRGDYIMWESGEVEEIPDFENRFINH